MLLFFFGHSKKKSSKEKSTPYKYFLFLFISYCSCPLQIPYLQKLKYKETMNIQQKKSKTPEVHYFKCSAAAFSLHTGTRSTILITLFVIF